MKIVFLGNSGFALEQGNDLLLIDCYNPEEHALLKPKALEAYRAVTVLISHRHGDHFGRRIHEVQPAAFVAGFDVPLSQAVKLRPGEKHSANGADITAYGSTDEGVSFHILWKGWSLFHAGDLNNWHWRDESEKAYADEAEANFLRELGLVQEGVQTPIDIAFFPVDARMGTDYYRGAVYFADALRPSRFVPMHFRKAFNPPKAFYEEMALLTELLTEPIEKGFAVVEKQAL